MLSPKTFLCLVGTCLSAALPLSAAVKMPGIFGDHMVLQQDTQIPVWGWADSGEKITVTLGKTSATTQAGPDGKWRLDLAKTAATHEPQTLTVSATNTLVFQDVLVGDVWLCSGQSNMEFGIFNIAKDEVLPPEVRLFHVTKSAALTPLDDTTFVPAEVGRDTLSGHWQKDLKAGSWNGFSAVGFLFGKEIHARTGQPVGLIGSYWGGTPAQAWTSRVELDAHPALARYATGLDALSPEQKKKFPVVWADYVRAGLAWDREVWAGQENYGKAFGEWQALAKKAKDSGAPVPPQPVPSRPRPANPGNVGTATTLFNGMIHPLIPYALKGVIWYQGESNANNGVEYGTLFPAMITDWRRHWNRPDLPFLFVQVAGYGPGPADPSRGRWAVLREGQSRALTLPGTGMATAIDIGDEKDIHPRNKADVAHRLALLARRQVYVEPVVATGPTYDRMTVEGARIRIAFKPDCTGAATSLVLSAPPAAPGKPAAPAPAALTGFEIAGADKHWVPADALIDGATVVVTSAAVPAPVAVHYAWSDCPPCSLYNREGLPAYPFRTDTW